MADLLEDWGCHSYPFMVKDLARWVGAELVPYSRLSGQERKDALGASTDAFTVFESGKPIILYNDYVLPTHRRRFSMGHEIAHIWLGHKEQTAENEQVADYFSGYLLAPHPLIIKHKLWDSIKMCFETTDWCARFAFDQARERMAEQRAWSEYERRILCMIDVIGGFPCQAVA